MPIESVTKDELLSFLENEVKFRIDTIVEGAVEMAEEVHAGVKREDGTSSFLQLILGLLPWKSLNIINQKINY